MFYKMITKKRDEWFSSNRCNIKHLIDYMETTGQLRDVQIDAIKTYLFLKIEGQCKPLAKLFQEGFFNSIDIDDLEVSRQTREYLKRNTSAMALLEYASLTNDDGEQVSENLQKLITKEPESIDYSKFFADAFYNVSYTDYLFSLPMGAGKTYLMAAFIYLDLYFANNEPTNPIFAHNFIIFAPSGLKSSVVPSLKTIQKFNPAWVIPKPAATDIKRKIIFEVLDQDKSKSKSNKTKNPNVQKVANHQPLSELFGLVAVTNAEKVILDRIQEKNGQLSFLEESDDDKDRQANELRNLLGKLPYLSVFIDEVHHAVSDEIKLRAVVNRWAENHTVNSVIGFSGTPYIDKIEKMKVTDKLSVGTAEITNIVYYYPLINGVGNFLKRPVVKIASNLSSADIIENGVREFLDSYRDTIYDDGTVAKLGIYCGSIEKLEEIVYPLVLKIALEYHISADEILRFHKGNKKYPQPTDSQMQYDVLDKPLSKIRIVLLVQIGKEGWDCRSLTGIILSQEGDCPTKMVLQTSCRCLRQVVKGKPETAFIYLNESNADKLNKQLKQQHHISIKEFQEAANNKVLIKRYNRMKHLKLPKVEFYQLKVNYESLIVEPANINEGIKNSMKDSQIMGGVIRTTDLTMRDESIEVDDAEKGTESSTFMSWVYVISKEGFGEPTIESLLAYEKELREIFGKITYSENDVRYYSSKYDHKKIRANIRKAFRDKRDFTTIEEVISEKSSLLNIANFKSEIYAGHLQDYYPDYVIVDNIIKEDSGKLKMDSKTQQLMQLAQETGNVAIVESLKKQYSSHPYKDRCFHYLPYLMDSSFEQIYLKEVLSMKDIENYGLEVYYNGDRAMTEFKIKCYKSTSGKWRYIGMYTPDFLIIQRNGSSIHKIVIVETKGEIYANDPRFKDKKAFMQEYFIGMNNEKYGYERFDYLYLEDTLSDKERILQTHQAINSFFEEVTENAD